MFIAGQRWICDSELSLGLGTVLKSDFRTVTIVFLASGETRTYSQQTAPLRRAAFNIGDTVESHEGWQLKITRVNEHEGLISYEGFNDANQLCTLEEGHLSNNIQLNRPYDRLFSGQIDSQKWFDLRTQCRTHNTRLANSDLTGLYDARTSLVPHQLYIAHEVAKRFAPRVLLADEVGLGKTIEACMIMQHQLITGRAERVLIVVPEALMHQWLVELMRRFSLTFSVFDEERCEAIIESTDFNNPFHAEQLVLCNLGFLTRNPEQLKHAIGGNWDLVIIDEAHHLQWSEENPSIEYKAVDAISQQSKGLLLLTATPEQLGKASHFARLRLLDPQRFHDFNVFVKEEAEYQETAATIEAILDDKPLTADNIKLLSQILNDDSFTLNQVIDSDKKQNVIDQLLDRHGTGRVLFRNTRHTIKGFPERNAFLAPLELPKEYQEINELAIHMELNEPELLIAPERMYQVVSNLKAELAGGNTQIKQWWTFDSRVAYLIDLLNKHKLEKILVICASSHTAQDLESAIRVKTGKRVTAFHEELSIIERDRAASYFADDIDGAQALICSEIGSEGRNFQFAHHLVLFDLPLNPDLLEQRIGRLDRIGQTETIKIHVPYFKNSAQEVMANWYMQGLNAFEKTCQVGETIYRKLEPALLELLQDPQFEHSTLDALVSSTKTLLAEYLEALQKGRDRLLELNSYKADIALGLQKQISEIDADPELQNFMEQAFGTFDVDSEIYRTGSILLTPGQHMHESVFHGLNEDGTVITFNRDTALANEDMQFVTWNHPFARDAIEMMLSNEKGNTSLVAIKTRQFKPGTLLIETYFAIECIFPEAIKAGLSVSNEVLHSIFSATGIQLNHSQIDSLYASEISNVDKKTSHKIIKSQMSELKTLMAQATSSADNQLPTIIKRNQKSLTGKVQEELDRLEALKQINPSIRTEEIDNQKSLLNIINERISASKIRLDAVRVIITH
ncbi:MAG: RNA polymerase-associated protein RapA [Gammaproteobacteria bacterium]|nr:RNA polymerase-associated protein RapA [Gammaproteobacteria bacterium]